MLNDEMRTKHRRSLRRICSWHTRAVEATYGGQEFRPTHNCILQAEYWNGEGAASEEFEYRR